MALLAHTPLKWIEDRLGYQGEDEGAGLGMLNMAGDNLVMPPNGSWKWLERESTLDHVADTDYIVLPTDLTEIIHVQFADTFTEVPIFTSMADLLNRVRGPSSSVSFHLAVIHNNTAGVITPRLRIFPTPTASESDVYNILYRAGWSDLTTPASVVAIPKYCWALYRELVLALALGFYEADDEAERSGMVAGVASRHTAAVWAGSIALQALQQDAMIQRFYGLPSDTIVNRSARHATPYANDTVTLT